MLYKVYVLFSPEFDKMFTGMTTSLIDRMILHNGDGVDEWTSAFKPWTLVHLELFNNESDAFIRETFLEGERGQRFIREDVLPLFNF